MARACRKRFQLPGAKRSRSEWHVYSASMSSAGRRIGTGLQSPFRHSEHQIQMEALCETIEKNLQSMQRDSLGDVQD